MTEGKGRKNRIFSPEYRVAVAKRIQSGEPVLALSRELGIARQVLYRWRDAYRKNGKSGVSGSIGHRRPRAAAAGKSGSERAERHVAELERKVGQQALQIDFLRRAFKRVKELRQESSAPGGTASTERSGA